MCGKQKELTTLRTHLSSQSNLTLLGERTTTSQNLSSRTRKQKTGNQPSATGSRLWAGLSQCMTFCLRLILLL